MGIVEKTEALLCDWKARSHGRDLESFYRGHLCVVGNDGFAGVRSDDGITLHIGIKAKDINEAKLLCIFAINLHLDSGIKIEKNKGLWYEFLERQNESLSG